MSVWTVAKKDILAASRSRALWAIGLLLMLLGAVIAFGYTDRLPPTESVRQLFVILGVLLATLLPIVALISSYNGIVGERESGGMTFLLGFPNTRRDIYLGKLISRLCIIGGGVLFFFGATASVAVSKHGAFPLTVVLGLLCISLLYASVFVGIGVALSAAVSARSRAIASAVSAYFVLVILFLIPQIHINAIVRWIHTTILGFAPNPHLYHAVTYVSPFIAFQKAMNLIFPPSLDLLVFQRGTDAGSTSPVYLSNEFSLVVFAAWFIIPLILGYLRFNRVDIT